MFHAVVNARSAIAVGSAVEIMSSRWEPDDGLARPIHRRADEEAIVAEMLDLDGCDILELGCGRAEKTRVIATAGKDRRITALEVDRIQHERNQRHCDLPNVTFGLGAAQSIPAPAASFDVALLFKSLHHVPVEAMATAMAEITRVLRPGGHVYVSEPLFRGSYNDVLRIFHDEQRVRRAAFEAMVAAVQAGILEPVAQTFFLSPVRFADFSEYERLVIGATHTRHELDAATRARVREAFECHVGPDGACFDQPIRVDLLRRPV